MLIDIQCYSLMVAWLALFIGNAWLYVDEIDVIIVSPSVTTTCSVTGSSVLSITADSSLVELYVDGVATSFQSALDWRTVRTISISSNFQMIAVRATWNNLGVSGFVWYFTVTLIFVSFRHWQPWPVRNCDSSIFFDWHLLRNQLLNTNINKVYCIRQTSYYRQVVLWNSSETL